MTVDIHAMREMLAKATPGQWSLTPPYEPGVGQKWAVCHDAAIEPLADVDLPDSDGEDAAFIVAAHNEMPAILSELESARARITTLEAAVRKAGTMKLHWSSRKWQAEFRKLVGEEK